MHPAVSPSLPSLDALEAVTRDLSRFAGSAAGLGSVLGGAFCLVAYLAHGAFPSLPVPARFVFATFPFLWIVAKEILRRRYYQQFGLAIPPASWLNRLAYVFCFVVTCVACAKITIKVIALVPTWNPPAVEYVIILLPAMGYLAIVMLLPFCVLCFRSVGEYIVGVFLLCQAAVGLVGVQYRFTDTYNASVPVMCVMLIAVGTYQHRRFLVARDRLFDLRAVISREAA
ncbi:MAG: hypothetical protein WBD40_13445 [Tepidisphaeraceae bacterium]